MSCRCYCWQRSHRWEWLGLAALSRRCLVSHPNPPLAWLRKGVPSSAAHARATGWSPRTSASEGEGRRLASRRKMASLLNPKADSRGREAKGQRAPTARLPGAGSSLSIKTGPRKQKRNRLCLPSQIHGKQMTCCFIHRAKTPLRCAMTRAGAVLFTNKKRTNDTQR